MLPTYERLDGPKPLFRVPFGKIALVVVSLPLGSFTFCVFWSLLFNFVGSTATHCEVPNFLPSISSAIGNYQPQKTVWRLAILLHLPARIAVARMYLKYYRECVRRNRRPLAAIACVLNVCEDFALLSLSFWTSGDNYVIHRNSFVVFIVCSEFYMLLSLVLNGSGRKVALTPIEQKSLRYKRNLFVLNVLSFCLAGYFFMRHNKECEPGAYSKFAYFEYWFMFANGNFFATAVLDLHSCCLTFDLTNGLSCNLHSISDSHNLTATSIELL